MDTARYERNGTISEAELQKLAREQAERRELLRKATAELEQDLRESTSALPDKPSRSC
jgi:hypothetical protein